MVYLHQHNRCKSNITFFPLHDSRRTVKIIAKYRNNPLIPWGSPLTGSKRRMEFLPRPPLK